MENKKTTWSYFEQWAELVHKNHQGNGDVALCWAIATLFKDVANDKLQTFPLLMLYGEKASGKSVVAKRMMWFLGESEFPVLAVEESGKNAILSKLKQGAAALYIDEFTVFTNKLTNSILKQMYDCGSYYTVIDHEQKETKISATACIVGSKAYSVEPAMYSRMLSLNFKLNYFTQDDRTNYESIERFQSYFSNIKNEILVHKELVESEYLKEYSFLKSALEKRFNGFPDIDTRLIRNAAQVLTPSYILAKHDQILFPWDINDLFAFVVRKIQEQANITKV